MNEYLFITDIEGCSKKLYGNKFMTEIVCKSYLKKTLEKWIKKGKHLIFGGDYFDHGSLKNIKTFITNIVELHRQYPDKVSIILGNRDLNKMRLYKEITGFRNMNSIKLSVKNIIFNKKYVSNNFIHWINKELNLEDYLSTFGLSLGDTNSINLLYSIRQGDLEQSYKYLLKHGKIMMTIPFNNKIAVISHSGINLTEELLGDDDKYLKETNKLFSIILKNSIAFIDEFENENVSDLPKLKKSHKLANYFANVYKYLISKDENYHLNNLILLKEEVNNKKMSHVNINIKNINLNSLSECAYIMINLLTLGLNLSPVVICPLTKMCEKHNPFNQKKVKVYKQYGIEAICFGHQPNCSSLPIQYYEGNKYNNIKMLSADTTAHRYAKVKRLGKINDVLFIPSIIELGKFNLYALEKINSNIELFPVNNIYMNRVLSWEDKSPKKRNLNESQSHKIYDLFWKKKIVHSKLLNSDPNGIKLLKARFSAKGGKRSGPVKVPRKYLSKKIKRSIPQKYLPKHLSKSDRKKQLKSLLNGTNRPKINSYKSKKSRWVVKFEKKYNKKITDKDFIRKNILKEEGINQILDKGMGAYYSSGSRPNQSKESWAFARLASVIVNGPARKVDKKIWDEFKI